MNFIDSSTVDISMTEGKIDKIEKEDEWVQATKIGLISQEGDWVFDPAMGLPYVEHKYLPPGREHILGRNPPPSNELIKVYLYQQLARDPRTEEIKDMEVTWGEKGARQMLVSATIKSIEGIEKSIEI